MISPLGSIDPISPAQPVAAPQTPEPVAAAASPDSLAALSSTALEYYGAPSVLNTAAGVSENRYTAAGTYAVPAPTPVSPPRRLSFLGRHVDQYA